MLFSQLLGNEKIKQSLRTLLTANALPQVLLFHGPEGVGKRQFALQLAEQLIGPQSSLDLQVVIPEEKSDVHPVERMRSLLEQTHLPPTGQAKVFVFDEAHKMLAASSNALLKMLEEPPKDVYFFLLTTHKDALLPTIFSRCHAFSFSPLSNEEVAAWIASEKPTEAKRLALLAQGSLSKAKNLLQEEMTQCFAMIRTLFLLSLPQEYEKLSTTSEALEQIVTRDHNAGFWPFCMEEMLLWLRDIECISIDSTAVYHAEDLDLLRACNQRIRLPIARLVDALATMRQALLHHVRLKTAIKHFFLLLSLRYTEKS